MSCTLFDVHYYLRTDHQTCVYEVEEDGSQGHLVRDLRRLEPRNFEQWLGQGINDLLAGIPHTYECGCGFGSNDWTKVVSHLEMYYCRGCEKLTSMSEGWDYLCPPCDRAANPDYHQRNPGWHR